MGEGRDIPPETERHTVAEAAAKLGITTGAVRNRLSRGTLQSVKQGGTVYVLLPADTSRDAERDTADIPGGIPHPERDPLTSELRDRLRYVEGQLELERQAHAEARRIIAGLVERMPQLEAPSEPPGAPSEATPQPGRVEPQPAVEGTQEPAERRSWWRRMFGT